MYGAPEEQLLDYFCNAGNERITSSAALANCVRILEVSHQRDLCEMTSAAMENMYTMFLKKAFQI